MTDEEYKNMSVKEFTKAAKNYESDHAGIYKMCKKDYPDILEELEKEDFSDLLDAGCGPAPMISLLAEKYPDRFKAAVTLDAFCKEADSILNHFIDDLHAKVFKFEVSVGGGMMGYHKNFIIDGEPFGKIFEKISKVEKATLVLDIGSPFMESCQVEAVDRLAQKYPNLNIVVCHLLAPRREDGATLEKALPYLKHKNVWIDLSALPWNVSPEAYPYPTALKFISMAKEVLGTEKIIWGTDSPCVMTKFKYADLYNFIIESDVFTEKELEMVFYQNAVEAYYLG